MNPELRDRSLLVGLLLIAWAVLVYLKTILNTDVRPDLSSIISQVQVLMGGVVGYHVGTGASPTANSPTQVPVPLAQGGFAALKLMVAIAVMVTLGLVLGGCTTTTASIYSGLYTQAKTGVQVFDDNTLTTMKDLVCEQPYSAIQRHPELQPGVVALCGPMTNTASLDPAQVVQMLNIAKQLGLVPAPK